MSDWNEKVIAEFRANEGRVGGGFEGAPMVLLHHTGRRSGSEYVTPLVYLPDPTDAATIYVFASAAGAPKDPQWYGNIVATGETTVEVGTETYPVRVETLSGEERERIYAAQVQVMPGFGEYARRPRASAPSPWSRCTASDPFSLPGRCGCGHAACPQPQRPGSASGQAVRRWRPTPSPAR